MNDPPVVSTLKANDRKADHHDRLTRDARGIVLLLSVSMFLPMLDEAIVVTVIPRIAQDFNVPPLSLSLAVSIYMIGAVIVLPASGWVAERLGIRRSFLIANLAFGCTSLLCALAPGYWPLIAGRALQGMAGGMIGATGRLILLRTINPSQYVAALSLVTTPMMIGPTIGPALGGLIVTWADWPLVFLINLPIVALVCLGSALRLPALPRTETVPLDWVGALLAAVAMVALFTGLASIGRPDATLRGVGLLACGLGMSWWTFRHLRTHPSPLVSLNPFSYRDFRTATISGGIILRLPLRGLSFVLPLLFQVALDMSPLQAGLLVMALAAGDLIFKPVVAPLYRRTGHHRALLASGAVGIAATLALLAVSPHWPEWAIGLTILCAGMARCVLFTGLATLGVAELPPAMLASANVLLNISQQLSAALAVAIVTLVIQVSTGGGHSDLGDFRMAIAALATCGIVGLWAMRHANSVHR